MRECRLWLSLILLLSLAILSCAPDQMSEELTDKRFSLLDNTEIGVDFVNQLQYDRDFNVYKYRNYYNGGGVAIGDVNGDSLPDIYMTANLLPNHLYLNLGDWKFEEVAAASGVQGEKAWSTGVTMADVNADGLLDIYVCNSGDVAGDNKENELFINQGDGRFLEEAAVYGLNDRGFSTHASFFDYDKDGDLDVYLLNNSFQAIGSFNLKVNERPKRDSLGGDKLLRNEGGKYVDVSQEAGIYGSVIGFGLGVTVADLNNDGWEDIFISNDFFERDYIYINNQDGTFTERLTEQVQSTSGASMGADIADINNDGFADIFVTEMLPIDYERLKSVTTFEDWNKYQYNVKNGYHHQFTRNVLHLNNGNDSYSEVSRMMGVEASDWSWGALLFDMDNDGYRDLYIANGIYRDLTDQDYLQYVANESVLASIITEDSVNYKELIDIIPSRPVPNQAYRNVKGQDFTRFGDAGLQTQGFSNGAAYGDLDNDGDLDLVVNNVNMPAFVYRNETNDSNYVRINLWGNSDNYYGYGTKIIMRSSDLTTIHEVQPARGFQSSMDPRPVIGLGGAVTVDIDVIWPNGAIQSIEDVSAGSELFIDIRNAELSSGEDRRTSPTAANVISGVLPYKHKENRFVDFNQEPLTYHMLSTQGPRAATADLNGDNIEDVVVTGSKGSRTQVWYGSKVGKFRQASPSEVFEGLAGAEHVDVELFDADADGDIDMYLASGGVELSGFSPMLYDRLLLNDGFGAFSDSGQMLPSADIRISTGAVASGDLDGDGDLDLVVGERAKVGQHGAPTSAYILINDGTGKFTDVSVQMAPDFQNVGMVTDLAVADLDNDGTVEIVIAGEYLGVQVYTYSGEAFTLVDNASAASLGWWNTIELVDVDDDGLLDIVAGNHGLNSRFRASREAPIHLYYNDYDRNGFGEGIVAHKREDGAYYPYALRHKLLKQLSYLTKKYPDFQSFKGASMTDIFGAEVLDSCVLWEANELRSMIWRNKGALQFEGQSLPSEVQRSPIYAIYAKDIDTDGDMDLLMGGNLFGVKPEMGRYDASYGHVLINDGKGAYTDQSVNYGIRVDGEVRDILPAGDAICFLRNSLDAQCHSFTSKDKQ